ncbi:hypothetical protein BMD20_29485 [Burkholderia multivorans]|nr:hypothetical protein BMD20_29485 [Burkholderia multivorans]KHS10395.1 hypothetical protein BMD22_28345 [Burkholderia multivorans]
MLNAAALQRQQQLPPEPAVVQYECSIGQHQGFGQVGEASIEAAKNVIQRNRVAATSDSLRDAARRKLSIVQSDEKQINFVPSIGSLAHQM